MDCPWCKNPATKAKTKRIGDLYYYECGACYFNWTSTESNIALDDSKVKPDLWWEDLPRRSEKCPHCGEKI